MINFRDLFYSLFPQTNLNKYLIYRPGNCPIVISAPHGGDIKPYDIPYRTYGNRSRDTYTRTLLQRILETANKKPYFIYADIHRSRVDLNREIKEACQGNKKAEEIWTTWNTIISGFINDAVSKYGKVLYIDLHSHNNSDEFQIGYGLNVKNYLDVKAGWDIKANSTMYAFKDGSNEFPALFGEFSFPRSIENHGYKVLTPHDEKDFLNGGRNTRHFSNANVGALQIECPIPVLKKNLHHTAYSLVDAIEIFRNNFMSK